MNYFENNNSKSFNGLDLKIDSRTLDLCDLSNKSSGHTRAILYVVVIVCITSLIAVVNTFPFGNWTKERINHNIDKACKQKQTLLQEKNYNLTNVNQNRVDSIQTEIEATIADLQNSISNKNEKIAIVELPLIGNTFDINNLAILTGISFIFLLIILRYTLSREKKNLRIALHSITKRYPYSKDYSSQLAKYIDVMPDVIISADCKNDSNFILDNAGIDKYNKTRRRFHYNYLTMNEVFNTPEDTLTGTERNDEKQDTASFRNTPIAKFVTKNLFFLPFTFYVLIFVNDSLSAINGWDLSPIHTLIQFLLSYLCLSVISILCFECNNQKLIAQAYYKNFKINDYIFNYNKNEMDLPERSKQMLFYPIILTWNFIKVFFSRVFINKKSKKKLILKNKEIS